MSEEKECKCFCKSEGFRKFIITAFGTFAGVYMALSLFSAIHKPPMPCPCHFGFNYPSYSYGQFAYPKHREHLSKKFYQQFKGEMADKETVTAKTDK